MTDAARGPSDLRAILGLTAGAAVGDRLPNQIAPESMTRPHLVAPAAPPEPVAEVIEPLAFRSPTHGDLQVLCVYSAKGGVGKTTVTTNLAARMAQHLGLHVLVIDLDVAFGDVGPRLQRYSPTVVDALGDAELGPSTITRWLHHDEAAGFWALLAPTRPDAANDRRLLSPTAFRRILAAAVNFDVVLLDCPVELSDPLVHRFAFRSATAICYVVTNERATLVDARRALEKITHPKDDATYPGYGVSPGRIGLLLNQHVDDVGVAVDDVARMLPGYPIVATIPDDRLAYVAAANGARHLALSDRPEVHRALDAAIGALLPSLAPFPGEAWAGSAGQLARLQEDLQRPRWPAAIAWLHRLGWRR